MSERIGVLQRTTKAALREATGGFGGMITFRDVGKSYGDNAVLKDVTFSAADGQVTGFVGPNGAGKSTAFKVLLGLEQADAGEALVDGHRYGADREGTLRVGSLLNAQWVPGRMTGPDYLRYLCGLRGLDASEAARTIALVGLGFTGNARVRTYSLGMRQRLGIAAAFLGNPRNLVLDEPVNGLDVDAVRWLRETLRHAANGGTCVLLSSHMMSELELIADSVVMLSGGQIIKQGSIAEVRKPEHTVVHVRSADNGRVARELAAVGAHVEHTSSAVVVQGQTVNWVAAQVSRLGVELESIERPQARLEDVYMHQVATNGVQS
ncbi:ABC transporter ATP-binding protein [Demequina sediminicola]|uniref:ABC transporter ATP-binding protein n=1 Tax=Demequina sediminicola TaxID=1095026 RepID=UPI0007841E09|nr:ATP-binding cassette domain-containing protein [Demequina sediminicola]